MNPVIKPVLVFVSVASGIVAGAYVGSDAMFLGLLVWKFAGMIGTLSVGATTMITQIDAARREAKADVALLQNDVLDKKQDVVINGAIGGVLSAQAALADKVAEGENTQENRKIAKDTRKISNDHNLIASNTLEQVKIPASAQKIVEAVKVNAEEK